MPAGVSLSRSWMSSQHALQVKILARMRDLGIVPILPAFQGKKSCVEDGIPPTPCTPFLYARTRTFTQSHARAHPPTQAHMLQHLFTQATAACAD